MRLYIVVSSSVIKSYMKGLRKEIRDEDLRLEIIFYGEVVVFEWNRELSSEENEKAYWNLFDVEDYDVSIISQLLEIWEDFTELILN